MPSITIEQKRKPSPSFEFCLTEGWGGGAGGRRGQTCQTEIYFWFVYFYCFKCFRIVLKSKGHARLFSKFVWQRKCYHCLKLSLADGYADSTYSWLLYHKNRNILQDCLFLLYEMLAISIERQRKRPPFLKLGLADGWAGGGRPGPH